MAQADPLERRATPERVWLLFKEKLLPRDQWQIARQHAGFIPTAADWRGFADRLMLILGTIFLIAGIFFFFAFNWVDLTQVQRFGILQATVVIAALLALWLKLDSWGGRVALLAAAMLIGVTLAVVGQAYQTGADSYRLFMLWTMLITGWVIISQWNAMWLVWMILINLTVALYWSQMVRDEPTAPITILTLIDLVFVLGWDVLTKYTGWRFLQDRWGQYLIATAALGGASFLIINDIFSITYSYIGFGYGTGTIIYLAVIGVTAGFYMLFRRDLPMLTLTSLSVLGVSITWIGWFLGDVLGWANFEPVSFLFVMGSIAGGITTVLVLFLRALNRRWAKEAGE